MIDYTLRDLLQIKNGKDHKHLGNGKIPVIGSGGIMRYANQALFDNESILLPRKGSLSNIQYVKSSFWTVDTLYYTIVNKKLANTFYLYNLLKTLDLSSLNSGTGVPSMTFDAYYDLKISLPDLITQQQIAFVLSTLEDKIELNSKINAELEAMAKTIYDYWFVQFDFPDKNGKPYKFSGRKMVWSEELKREIPEGWKSSTLSSLCSIISRGISPKYLESGGVCVLNQKCIRDNKIDFDFSRRHDNEATNAFNRRIKEYDILVNSTGVGTLGRVAMVKRMPEDFITVDSHVTIVRPNEKQIDEIYLGFTIVQKQKEIEGFSLGSTGQVELSRSQLESINVIVPDRQLQKKFRSFYSPLLQKMSICEIENQNLSELRDWLLPMLMNGQVSVGKAYDQVEEALSMAAEESEPYGKTLQLSIPKSKTIFAKQVLAGKIVSLFKKDKNFTHIKFQKLQFLAEHIAEADLSLNYYFQPAGPYDNRFMHTIVHSFKKSKWFDEQQYKFIELEKQSQIEGYYQGYFNPVSDKLEKLFKLLVNSTEAKTEIIATLYAVWNNRMILQQDISEEILMEDFYNWSDRKQRYSKAHIQQAIHWLKENGFEPVGFGKEIKRAKK